MEFDLIPQLIIVFSAGMVVLILGLNVSKIKNIPDNVFLFESAAEKKEKEKFFDLFKRITNSINKEEYQKKIGLFWIWLEKTLRKIRISFLKLDNRIVSLLGRLRERNIENIGSADKKEYDEDDIATGNIRGFKKTKKMDIATVVSNGEAIKSSETKDIGEKKEENTNSEIFKDELKSERDCINMIFKNPADIKAYWRLGIVYSRRKNYKDAVACFKQIIKIDPSYTRAKKKVVELIGKTERINSEKTIEGETSVGERDKTRKDVINS